VVKGKGKGRRGAHSLAVDARRGARAGVKVKVERDAGHADGDTDNVLEVVLNVMGGDF
jgi:hypothetical protein